jgi:hypothetical protein
MLASRTLYLAVAATAVATAQQQVSFTTQDGGIVHGDLYGDADRAVVLAHRGRFNKESWEEQARVLEAAGFRALAIVRLRRRRLNLNLNQAKSID